MPRSRYRLERRKLLGLDSKPPAIRRFSDGQETTEDTTTRALVRARPSPSAKPATSASRRRARLRVEDEPGHRPGQVLARERPRLRRALPAQLDPPKRLPNDPPLALGIRERLERLERRAIEPRRPLAQRRRPGLERRPDRLLEPLAGRRHPQPPDLGPPLGVGESSSSFALGLLGGSVAATRDADLGRDRALRVGDDFLVAQPSRVPPFAV